MKNSDSTEKKERKRYTCGKYTQNGEFAQKYGGWRKEGLDRFNMLYKDDVKKKREEYPGFDVEYLSICSKEFGATVEKGDKKKKADEIEICNDLVDFEDDPMPGLSLAIGATSDIENVPKTEI